MDARRHGDGAVHGAGPGPVLRRDGPLEEHPQHAGDEPVLFGHRARGLGPGQLHAGQLGQRRGRVGLLRRRLHRQLRQPRSEGSDRRRGGAGVRRLPHDVRGDHAGSDLGRRCGSVEVLGVGDLRAPLAPARLHAGHLLGLQRVVRPRHRGRSRCARLRRRDRHPHQRRCGSAGLRARAGQTSRMAERADVPALAPARPDRYGDPVVRLVRVQRRIGRCRRRGRGAGVPQHVPRRGGRHARMDGRRVDARRQSHRCSAPVRAPSPGSWRSLRPPGSSVACRPSCSASRRALAATPRSS